MKFAVNSISKSGAWSMQTEFDQGTPSTHMWPCDKNNKNDTDEKLSLGFPLGLARLPFRFGSPLLF